MGLAAAALGQYPYGGSARIMQYTVPSICMLAGLGASLLLVRLQAPPWGRRSAYGCAALLAMLGSYFLGNDLVRPYRVYEDFASRRFARWFWSDSNWGADLLCVKKDLGLVFQPTLWRTGMSAVYLYHERLYRHHREPAIRDLSTFEPSTPTLRLVFFDRVPEDKPIYKEWLARIRTSYQIGRRWEYVVNPSMPDDPGERDRYIVLELISRKPDRRLSVGADPHTRIRK
jgi:hypothetical protein